MRLAFAFALLSAAAPAAAAQDDPHDDEALRAELRALAEGAVAPGEPGGILGVLRRGEPFLVAPFGLAELESGRAVTADTLFYLASVAKCFTAACVLDAAAAGKLELDAPARRWVPALPERLGSVTLRQLLHHRSGLDDVYDLVIGLDLGRGPLASNAAAVELIARAAEPDFAPGTRCIYSNSGYVLLAEALRSATGRALPEYARERLFEPLGMRARFGRAEELADLPRAFSYARDGDGWRRQEILTGLVGPGGTWASLDDLARWERAAFEGGWGNEATREALVTPPALGPGESLHPAFGSYAGGALVGEDRGLRVVRLAGGAFGYGAEVLRYPDQELSVVALYNNALPLDDLAERAAEIALRGEPRAPEPEPRAAALSADELARFGRIWREEGSGVVWVLSLSPQRKVAASLGDWKLELVPLGPATLAARGARVPVELAFEPAAGPFERMHVLAGGARVATCLPHALPPSAPPAIDDYAGEYAFEPLGATLDLRAEGPAALRLAAVRPLGKGPPFELPPFQFLGDDLFVSDGGAQLQFRRADDGAVIGARLDVNRARGLELARR